jgi:hypothetical protein
MPVTGVFLRASSALATVLALAFARGEQPLRTRVVAWTLAAWAGSCRSSSTRRP